MLPAVVVVSALVVNIPPMASIPNMRPVVFVVGISFFINLFFAVAVLGSSSLFTPSVLYSHPLSVSSFSSLLSKYVSAALMVTIAPTTASDSRVAHRQQ
jgi:hypothetical protein